MIRIQNVPDIFDISDILISSLISDYVLDFFKDDFFLYLTFSSGLATSK